MSNRETYQPVTKTSQPEGRNQVLLIYTGGTLGMLPENETHSLTPSVQILQENITKLLAEQKAVEDFPHVEIYQYEEVMDSSDMGPSDWVELAQVIESHYYHFDGFVVVMGTDTMAYACSALSFMMSNLSKPIIFTGSMIPMYKGYSDAPRNLLLSITIAGNSNIPEVCIFFHSKLLRGNRSVKLRSDGLDAFDSPNFPPLATAGTQMILHENLLLRTPRKPLKVLTKFESSVLVIRLIPGFQDDTLGFVIENTDQLKALVLDLYGMGNAPGRKSSLIEVLKKAIAKDVVVAITSQCVQGSVNLKKYAVGRRLHEIGAISTNDMTVESISTKLAFLFGQGFTSEEVKKLLQRNIRGEITEDLSLGQYNALSML